MREVIWTDEDGRNWQVLLPPEAPDSQARKGIVIGPVDLGPLDLPIETEVRLHNQLHARKIFTVKDTKARRRDIVASLMAALRVDADKIVRLYTVDDN